MKSKRRNENLNLKKRKEKRMKKRKRKRIKSQLGRLLQFRPTRGTTRSAQVNPAHALIGADRWALWVGHTRSPDYLHARAMSHCSAGPRCQGSFFQRPHRAWRNEEFSRKPLRHLGLVCALKGSTPGFASPAPHPTLAISPPHRLRRSRDSRRAG